MVFGRTTQSEKVQWVRITFRYWKDFIPHCVTAKWNSLQMCTVVHKWAKSRSWQVATQIDDWNDQIFCTIKSEKQGQKYSVCRAYSSRVLKLTHWKRISFWWSLCILRHDEDVLSRLPQHPINIERKGGEAIFVPVSALIKTQPGGERPTTNGATFSKKKPFAGKQCLSPCFEDGVQSLKRCGMSLETVLPNVSNWQRCVSDGHQRSALIQEKHTVLFLKNLHRQPDLF